MDESDTPSNISMAQIISKTCDLCDENEAALFCYECKVAICTSCSKMHNKLPLTKHHTVAGLDKVDRLVYNCQNLCEAHKEIFSFNCVQCSRMICNSCLTSDHKDHSVCGLAELYSKTRVTVEENVTKMKITYQEITDMLEKVKIVHNQKVVATSEKEISEIQRYAKFLHEVVDDIERNRENEVKAFKEFESNQLDKITKTLEALHKEYFDTCNIFERMLEETHEITFVLMYNMHKQSFNQLDNIPTLCNPEERGDFEPDLFFHDLMSRIQTNECFTESAKRVATKILQNELDEHKAKINDLETKTSTLILQVDGKNKQLDEQSIQLRDFKLKVSDLTSDIDTKTKQLEEKNAEIRDLQSKIPMEATPKQGYDRRTGGFGRYDRSTGGFGGGWSSGGFGTCPPPPPSPARNGPPPPRMYRTQMQEPMTGPPPPPPGMDSSDED